ncbi:membrane glycoprotein vOX2-1 [Elephant endotheliotropic herpesvirus 2]|nr:membrane glycoprotein vOX2-1 [Elephant endotheliotropic herpesvirus 2]
MLFNSFLLRFVSSIAITLCTEQVVTQDKMELLSAPVSLTCSLQTDKEVLVVTWQKVKTQSPENMATFSENHGVVIQPPYKNRVNITQLDLKNSTLTFWNTTTEDEGCFLCLFNTFGSGKISGKTCLTLYVPPIMSLKYIFFEDVLNITCSATARPAPVILWKSAGLGIYNSTRSIINTNGTTSVTSILQFKDHKSQVANDEVICKVLHLGNVTEIREIINQSLKTLSVALGIIVFLIFLILILCYRIFIRE